MKKSKTKQEKEKTSNEISKKMSFAKILERKPEAATILIEKGMHCCGCPMAMQETLEAGASAHGLDVDKLVKELNEKLKKKK